MRLINSSFPFHIKKRIRPALFVKVCPLIRFEPHVLIKTDGPGILFIDGDFHDGKVIVHGKGSKDRETYINARAQMALDQYLAERSDQNPYLFASAKYSGVMLGKITKGRTRARQPEWYCDPDLVSPDKHFSFETLEEKIRKIGKRAGVTNTHPHRFRRTGATMALRQGMPLTTVSKLLGHESIETTQIYLDISDEELEQAHRKYVV